MKELLDIATNHALGEDTVRAIFDHHKKKKLNTTKIPTGALASSPTRGRKRTGDNMTKR